MNDLRRAIHYAAATLGLSHDAALLLPARVVAELWEERNRLDAASSAAQEQEDKDERDDRRDD